MPLTVEHKRIIIDTLLDEGDSQKGILEGTKVGETYGDPGGVTSDEISEFVAEVNRLAIDRFVSPHRKLILNFKQPIYFEMPDGRSLHAQTMKIIENGAGNGKHLVFAVLPLLGDMVKVEPPIESSIWLGLNMLSIHEIKDK